MHETTLEEMREMFYSDFFPRTNLGQYRAAGEPDVIEEAGKIARKRIASHDRRLDSGVQSKIDAIYEEARKRYTV